MWKPKPMNVQCPQCKKTGIFTLKSDVILGFHDVKNVEPSCKSWEKSHY